MVCNRHAVPMGLMNLWKRTIYRHTTPNGVYTPSDSLFCLNLLSLASMGWGIFERHEINIVKQHKRRVAMFINEVRFFLYKKRDKGTLIEILTLSGILILLVLLILICSGCDSVGKRLEKAKAYEEQGDHKRAKAEYVYIAIRYPDSDEALDAEQCLLRIEKKLAEIAKVRRQLEEEQKEIERKRKAEEIRKHKEFGEKLAKEIVSRYDEMEDITWYHPKNCKNQKAWNRNDDGIIDDGADGNWNSDCAVYAYIGGRDNHVWTRFYCGVESSSWLFLEKLIFLRNDEGRIEIPVGFEKKSEVLYGGHIKEWVDLSVDKVLNANLLLIGMADRVKMRFSGSRRNEDFILTPKERKDILTILSYSDWLEKEQKYASSN